MRNLWSQSDILARSHTVQKPAKLRKLLWEVNVLPANLMNLGIGKRWVKFRVCFFCFFFETSYYHDMQQYLGEHVKRTTGPQFPKSAKISGMHLPFIKAPCSAATLRVVSTQLTWLLANMCGLPICPSQLAKTMVTWRLLREVAF